MACGTDAARPEVSSLSRSLAFVVDGHSLRSKQVRRCQLTSLPESRERGQGRGLYKCIRRGMRLVILQLHIHRPRLNQRWDSTQIPTPLQVRGWLPTASDCTTGRKHGVTWRWWYQNQISGSAQQVDSNESCLSDLGPTSHPEVAWVSRWFEAGVSAAVQCRTQPTEVWCCPNQTTTQGRKMSGNVRTGA
jgi:hypothetical protein